MVGAEIISSGNSALSWSNQTTSWLPWVCGAGDMSTQSCCHVAWKDPEWGLPLMCCHMWTSRSERRYTGGYLCTRYRVYESFQVLDSLHSLSHFIFTTNPWESLAAWFYRWGNWGSQKWLASKNILFVWRRKKEEEKKSQK